MKLKNMAAFMPTRTGLAGALGTINEMVEVYKASNTYACVQMWGRSLVATFSSL